MNTKEKVTEVLQAVNTDIKIRLLAVFSSDWHHSSTTDTWISSTRCSPWLLFCEPCPRLRWHV